MSDKVIHFGQFIRHHRLQAGKTTEAFGREAGLTARRVIAIEKLATPEIHNATAVKLAKAIGVHPQKFDALWRNTPVPMTDRRPGPTTDEARRFGIACDASRITTAEGLRRMRTWLIHQPASVQKQVLEFDPAVDPLFTDLVDHLQDPADAVRRRAGQTAASSGGSAGSAATTGNKRR